MAPKAEAWHSAEQLAGSSWSRILPLVLHAVPVTQTCPPFCVILLSGNDPGLIWNGWNCRLLPVLLWATGMGERVGWSHGLWGRPVGIQNEILHEELGPVTQPFNWQS